MAHDRPLVNDRPRLVLDASVVVKWYLRENHSKEAVKLKDFILKESAFVAVPELFFIEVANVIWKKSALLKEISKIEAREIYREISRLPFQVLPNHEILDEAFRLSLGYSVSIYDALYLAGAQELGALFITSDSAFEEKLQSTQLSRTIVPLAGWETRILY